MDYTLHFYLNLKRILQAKINHIFSFIVLVLLTYTIASCEQEIKKYAVFSHTRLDDNSGLNTSLNSVDFSKFDVLMLGGDMANLSSLNSDVLNMLDSVFDLSSSNTLWALGNHDYSNIELLKEYTEKNNYYSFSQDNTLFIVLDTQLDSSRVSGEQLQFFESVTDSMNNYSNLVILTHKLIWMRRHSSLENQIGSVSNGHLGDCSYCIQSNNFYTELYPTLLRLKSNNVNVYCVAGDIGFKMSKYEYVTKEGIVFLATGMNSKSVSNHFIEFSNNLRKEELSYEFKLLEN